MRFLAIAVWGLCGIGAAHAGDLVVKVTGIRSSEGQIGCALFSAERGFPTDAGTAQVRWLAADPAGVRCAFESVSPGTYAVSVIHDLNGNRKTDTNFLGMPIEDWGVSNNIRPSLRAPRFDEAAVRILDAQVNLIDVTLAR